MVLNTTLGRSKFFKTVAGSTNGNGNTAELAVYATVVADTTKPLTVQSREYLNTQFSIPYGSYNVMWAKYYDL